VPHIHHDEQEPGFSHECAQEEMSVLDYLSQMFHFSSGERQLEDYRANNGLSAVFLLPKTIELPAFIPFRVTISHFFPDVVIQETTISAIALRGPPVVS
jgi:hypothetical protein